MIDQPSSLKLNNIRTIEGMAVGALSIMLILDLLLFPPLMHSIEQARIRRAKDVSVVNFFKNLIAEKYKFTGMKIIPQEKIDDVLDKIQEIAGANNMEVTIGSSVEADTQDKGDHPYARKIFSLQALGSFQDLGVFLTSLRNLPDVILDVENMHIFSDKKDTAKLQAQIIFVILTAKDDENK